MFNDSVRKGIYAVAVAALGVLAVYGFVNDQQVEALSQLVAALVALLAFVNTKPSDDSAYTGKHRLDETE